MKKPKPSYHYDIHEVTEYLDEKYGFTNDDWDEVIDSYINELSNGCMLTITNEDDNKLKEAIINEFGNGESQVDIHYWW